VRIVLADVVATELGLGCFAVAGAGESVELMLVKVDMGEFLKDEGGKLKAVACLSVGVRCRLKAVGAEFTLHP